MAYPKAEDIQEFLKAALLKEGFTKKSYVAGAYTVEPEALPEDLERLVRALSTGLAGYWTAWQGQVTVVIPPTGVVIPVTSSPGMASAGYASGVGSWVGGTPPTPNGNPGIPRLTPPLPGGLV